jgi:hypothetical protein
MGLFYQITDDAFPGARSIDFIGQRIVGVEPFGRYWFWSSLVDASTWNSLDSAQAETSPDRIKGLIVSHNEVLIFGERTIEPWAHAPTESSVFQLQTGSVIESGCASGNTIKRLDNSVFYLTDTGQVARLNGYTPQIISTQAMEASIRDLNWSRAFAFTWEDSGHAVYYITFPDGYTWGYDVRQGRWHRRESYGMDRWRINALCKSNGRYIAGDYSSGAIYALQWGYVYEGCEIMPRKFRTGVLHDNGNRISVHGIRLNVATGGEPSLPNCTDPEIPVDPPIPTEPGIVLVTGAFVGDDKYAKSLDTDPITFEAIPATTGADIDADGTAAYGGGIWSTLGTSAEGGRFSEDDMVTWQASAIVGSTGTFTPKHHVYGYQQFVALDTPITNQLAVSNWPPTEYTVQTAPEFPVALGYAKDYWYLFTGGNVLYRTLDFSTYQTLFTAGSGASYHYYFQFKEFDGYVYATRFQYFDALTRRHQLVRSASGLFNDTEIIINRPAGESDPLYWLEVVGDVLAVYLSGGKVLNSGDGFTTELDLGLTSPPSITSGPLMQGARKMTTDGVRLFVLGGSAQVAYTSDFENVTLTTTGQSVGTSIVGRPG